MVEISQETLPDLAKRQGHKFDHGHAVVVAGGPGRTGAARLAARGALRAGAGLVTLACPMRSVTEIGAQVTAIMVAQMDGPSGLEEILEDDRMGALCLGPGLGLMQTTAELVRVALATGRPCVLDADALSRFERAPDALFAQVHDTTILTPHWGEFGRLFPDLAQNGVPQDRPGHMALVQAAAQRAGCIVLLKGEHTVIAMADGSVACHAATGARAVPWLATAGAGDVLSGIITGLLARGLTSMQAASAATWLHVEAARLFGPGLIAEDLPEVLPCIFAALEATSTAPSKAQSQD